MKNVVKIAILAVALVSACGAQEAMVNVSTKGKQEWSQAEVNKIYLSACSAVQREFGNNEILRPRIALILGADKDVLDFDKKTVLLVRWDRNLFAQGVVILAFEDLLSPRRRMLMANRAVNWADATVDARGMQK
jgi:hypothetical protein